MRRADDGERVNRLALSDLREAKNSIVYLIPRWDAERGCVVKGQKWKTAGTDKDRASKQLADRRELP